MSKETENDPSKALFTAIESGDRTLLQTTLTSHPNVNLVDENLMTPLQHAAYKGYKDMVQLLLDYGADPNLCEHQHNYTALHFAALSGNYEVCLALLIAGARTDVVNTVNRTAAQMAAFVGHHTCVAIINNYIEKAYVDYYTVPQGTQTEPYLPPFLSNSFHKLIIDANVHPVKIILNVHKLVGLSDHLPQVKKVLEMMAEKEIKKGNGSNEVTGFKFFYISYLIGELMKIKTKHKTQKHNKKIDSLEVFCRNVLQPGTDGSLELMDCLLKECLKEFPYRECTLLRHMVSTLTSQDAPTALSVITSIINGQHGFIDNTAVCYTCGEEKPSKKCSQCKTAQYCDKDCQKLHWYWHKKKCSQAREETCGSDKKTPVDPNELVPEIKKLLVSE